MEREKGFIEYKRKVSPYRSISERIKDYNDVNTYLSEDEIEKQASRCMDCGIPFCHSIGCPLSNLIPEWNKLVSNKQWKDALMRLEKTNMLPEITGRICPGLCETSCTLSVNHSPVTIRQIELAIIEKGFKMNWVMPVVPKVKRGKKIAIIGSGPAGLSAAQLLRVMGYEVTVFEKSLQAGGILRYGIPNFKLEKWVIDRRINLMKESQIIFETDVKIGEDISYHYLNKRFDAILLTTGIGVSRDLPIPGRNAQGIYFSIDYLNRSNQCLTGELQENKIVSAHNKNVIIIGGGDTGADCVGIANRQGAKKILQLEIMPKPKSWNYEWNPNWPNWPVILRTCSSHEEGVQRKWSILTKEFITKQNKVTGIRCVRLKWNRPENGDSLHMIEIPNSEFNLQADIVLLALGFTPPKYSKLYQDIGIELDKKGNIKINQEHSTSVEGIFAAGDSCSGASLVVNAILHGREAAKAIDRFLENK